MKEKKLHEKNCLHVDQPRVNPGGRINIFLDVRAKIGDQGPISWKVPI